MSGTVPVPKSFILGVVMYIITSLPAGIWFAADISSRLNRLEFDNQSIPARIAVLENRVIDTNTLLKELRDDIRQRFRAESTTVPQYPRTP